MAKITQMTAKVSEREKAHTYTARLTAPREVN